jgi:isopenicillin N synthase-like dioxygenase
MHRNIPESSTGERTFNPFEKEEQLRREAATWDTSRPQDVPDGDVPVINLSDYFSSGSEEALAEVGARLRAACEEVGFFTIVGHGVSAEDISALFEMVRRFHDLPDGTKQALQMDRADWPVGGVGYLPVGNRKLPARPTANLNETFIVKRDHTLFFDDNQWPEPDVLPGFRERVERYALAMEALGKRLMPVFASALEMPADFFDEAFLAPQYRLRMTHYPVLPPEERSNGFGISPHVDTTFCTILAQDRPGLTIFDERRQGWIKLPLIEDAFIVNSGELLRQWTNDRFISVKHFANNNTGDVSRYSVPFFFNANLHHKMVCVPSCHGQGNPPKYPAISYAESQAVAQGE